MAGLILSHHVRLGDALRAFVGKLNQPFLADGLTENLVALHNKMAVTPRARSKL